MVKVLSCKCGDCLHWEIYKEPAAATQPDSEVIGRFFDKVTEVVDDAIDKVLGTDSETYMVCKTCGDKHHIKISFPDHEKLDWVEHAAA